VAFAHRKLHKCPSESTLDDIDALYILAALKDLEDGKPLQRSETRSRTCGGSCLSLSQSTQTRLRTRSNMEQTGPDANQVAAASGGARIPPRAVSSYPSALIFAATYSLKAGSKPTATGFTAAGL
jgi:hypothetical protein